MANKPFTLETLASQPKDHWKLNQIMRDDQYLESCVLQRKTFFGFFPHWVVVADLFDPVRDVDEEIVKAEAKLVQLKEKRKSKLREAHTIMKAIPQAYEKQKIFSLGSKANEKPIENVFPDLEKAKDKPKTRSVSTMCVPAKPVQNQGKNTHNKH